MTIEFDEDVHTIIDQANILSEETEEEINQIAIDLELENSSELGVLTVFSLEGTPVEQFSLEMARNLGIGTEENSNGILLLIAPNEKEVRIEVGYGLEGIITDANANTIIQDILIPYFENGNYDQGVYEASLALSRLAKKEVFQVEESEVRVPLGNMWEFLPALLMVAFLPILFLARSRSWWGGSVFGALFFGFFIAPFWVSDWSGILIFILGGIPIGLLIDYLISKYWRDFADDLIKTWWNTPGFDFSEDSSKEEDQNFSKNTRSDQKSASDKFGGGRFGGGGASGKW